MVVLSTISNELQCCYFLYLVLLFTEKSDDTKEVIRSQNSKHRQYNSQKKKTNKRTPTTKTDRHDIAEILLKVALKHQKSNQIINTKFDSSGVRTAYLSGSPEFTLGF
jgi:hypothetical protein